MNRFANGLISFLKRFGVFRALYRLPGVASAYHFAFAFVAALFYGFPSRKLVVIGVTGTKGKTTVCNLVAQLLESAGRAAGMATTVNFRIEGKEWVNDTKQTMLGRFELQKLLRDMVRAGCRYAVVETSSEAILQYRHRFIDYRIAVFTNLSPEHIERHGSFEKYREAKVELFRHVAKRKDGIGVYNLGDEHVSYFLEPEIGRKLGYAREGDGRGFEGVEIFKISGVTLGAQGSSFRINGGEFETKLIGEFNVQNAAAAILAVGSLGVAADAIKAGIRNASPPPGRLEFIEKGQRFRVVVDYAHEPMSLEALYEAVRLFDPKRVIGVLGSQGGGRDAWKRSAMGRIAAEYCDEIILTNEDPYDEPPRSIIKDIEKGIRETPRFQEHGSVLYTIIDRGEAIRKALSLAGSGDAVVISGKGGEVWMCVEGGKKIPWSDRKAVEEALEKEKRKEEK